MNGTIAQVVSLAQSCIVLCQIDKPKMRLALPRFKRLIKISGASYHIVRWQFPIMPVYVVTVHRVQGMTVKRAVVLLNKNFFESGQAYVALSWVRNYHPSAIVMLGFYRQLLQWCDAQDVIHSPSLPPIVESQYPSRPDTVSNEPLTLDSVEPENVPHEPDAVRKVQNLVKRNASSTGSTNLKKSCLSNSMVSNCVQTPACSYI